MAVRSLYELLNGSLSNIARQRMWFPFSGKVLDTASLLDVVFNNSQSGVKKMNDEGFHCETTSTTANSSINLTGNDRRFIDENASEGVWVFKNWLHPKGGQVDGSADGNWFHEIGFGSAVGNTGHFFEHHTGAGQSRVSAGHVSRKNYFRLQTSQGETHTLHDTGTNADNRWIAIRIKNSHSRCELSFDGALQTTATTGLQTSVGMQPLSYVNRGLTGAGQGAAKCTYRYMEVVNT